MKRPPVRRVSRYSKPTRRIGFKYNSPTALRRLAQSEVAEELREAQRGHIITHPHPHHD